MIEVQDLKKTFRVHQKEPGLKGSVRSLFSRKWVEKHALQGINLKVGEGEIVGLIGYKLAPDSEGRVEFGYGLAESRRRLGFGTQAVAALVRDATEDSDIRLLYAETLVGNIGSQKVLRANGFHQSATREDAEDGALLCWSRAV